MAAWTDAAGKYNPNAPLDGNEDNYYADDDLSDATPNHVVADEDVSLSTCGMLMAVADGMGGMNAGEVASRIAQNTVAEYFAPGKITPELAATHESRSRYMENVVRDADLRIKSDAKHNGEHEGMGSTLIMAWFVGNEMSLTWIGDSRAYRFNPEAGIELLSRDHTYVQELVDKGIITYEQTFDHPQGNIVTRSLGDSNQKAKPESRLFKVYDNDIILLCSDGLSGVLRDRKTYDENGDLYPEENIEDIIRENSYSLKECREALWTAAERADWYDNVTAILCKICGGAGEYVPEEKNVNDDPSSRRQQSILNKTFDGVVIKIPRKKFLPIIILLFIIFLGIGGFFLYNKVKPVVPKQPTPTSDTLKINEPTDTINKSEESVAPVEEEHNKTPHQNKDDADKKDKTQSKTDPLKQKEKKISLQDLINNVKKVDSLTKVDKDILTPAGK